MTYDRNPVFGADQRFTENARKATDVIWEGTGGDVSATPKSYLEALRHDYSDGKVSMLELIDRIDLGPEATYDDYCEVVEHLMSVEPESWPDPNSVIEVKTDRLLYQIEPEFSEIDDPEDWEFAEEDDFSDKVESFLKKVIASVYTDGVSSVTDKEGNPPNQYNSYLLTEDGKKFEGIFYDRSGPKDKQFPFEIVEKKNGWQIRY